MAFSDELLLGARDAGGDLDGNVLRLGSDSKPDEPIGDWLDMFGNRWVESGDGEDDWKRS